MRIDPDLRALRSNPASQRIAQTALERCKSAWRESRDNAAVFAELVRYGRGDHLGDCPALRSLFANSERPLALVEGLVAEVLPQLAAHPLGQVPFRHQHSGGMAVLQLAASRGAVLSLVMYERCGAGPPPKTICFTDTERHEIAIAGAGTMQIIRRDRDAPQASLCTASIKFWPGHSLSLSGMFETKRVESVADRLVILRLGRTATAPKPSVEFRLDDGILVHQAAGDKRDSCHEMMVSLLGRMGRRDAAPVLADMARRGSDHLRWQALCECLALDTATGFSALCVIARDAGDTLSDRASSLRAQLIEAHPQLAEFEETLCPA
ncbi:hypothetical protein [Allopontixanthobacter sediminis]|uniref:HEAT repeat domain-containing protein n=1 Tax=Allopontixanthobacter sediminis TaxID=1689985 RepID=A0A845BCZ9_9SPHN|nr:hypothetical protein [Allopontixanthobacter sediminis]MXP45439.1 hypothetical protein [Allopontixanthobacter sediminis]